VQSVVETLRRIIPSSESSSLRCPTFQPFKDHFGGLLVRQARRKMLSSNLGVYLGSRFKKEK
jgi:hypothetical protein